MQLAMIGWAIATGALVLLVVCVLAVRRVLRDRDRQAYDRMLPP
jgi:hypothetical protein